MNRALRCFALVLPLLLIGSSPAKASSITIYDYDAANGGNPDFYAGAPGGGGAFWAITNDASLGNFIAFCIEITEHISYGGTYQFDGLQAGATNGGASGGNPDPVSDASKWLYGMVVTGLYDDAAYSSYFDFNGASAGLGSVGSLVQLAIWNLEGETLGDYTLANLLNNNVTQIAIVNSLVARANTAASGTEWNTLQTDYSLNVGALNLYTGTSTPQQSQLGGTFSSHLPETPPTPTPEPGSLVLLGTGMAALARWRSKRATRNA